MMLPGLTKAIYYEILMHLNEDSNNYADRIEESLTPLIVVRDFLGRPKFNEQAARKVCFLNREKILKQSSPELFDNFFSCILKSSNAYQLCTDSNEATECSLKLEDTMIDFSPDL